MKLRFPLSLLLCATVLLIAGCQQKPSNILEFDAYLCEVSNDKCDDDPKVFKFKVRKFENQVLLNVFDSEGTALGNLFLEKCQIFNQRNWKCEDYEMVEGAVVSIYSEEKMHLQRHRSDYYQKYVPRE